MRVDIYKFNESNPVHTFLTLKDLNDFVEELKKQDINLFSSYDVALNDMIVYGWDDLSLVSS